MKHDDHEQHVPVPISKPVSDELGEHCTSDIEAAPAEEKRSMLSNPRGRQSTFAPGISKLWPLIIALLAAVALLWILFSGDSLEKNKTQQVKTLEKFLNRPVSLHTPDIATMRQDEVLSEDPCSILELAEDVLPFECLGADRQKSKAFFDACNEIVQEQGWSFSQLQACGMLEAGY